MPNFIGMQFLIRHGSSGDNKGMAKGVLFYVKHPQKIKENELGFMVAGMLIGGVVASFVFMMWSMFFAGETLPMPAKTKDE